MRRYVLIVVVLVAVFTRFAPAEENASVYLNRHRLRGLEHVSVWIDDGNAKQKDQLIAEVIARLRLVGIKATSAYDSAADAPILMLGRLNARLVEFGQFERSVDRERVARELPATTWASRQYRSTHGNWQSVRDTAHLATKEFIEDWIAANLTLPDAE